MAPPGLRDFQTFAQDFAGGVALGVQAATATAASPSFRALGRRYLKRFLLVLAGLYVVALLAWLPLAVLVAMVDAVTSWDMGSRLPTAFALLWKVSELTGPLLLMLLNYVYTSDAICDVFFFGRLAELDGQRAAKLKRLPFPPMRDLLLFGLKRYFTLATWGSAVLLISLLPGGPTVRAVLEALLHFFLMSKVFGYFTVGVAVALLRMVPDEMWLMVGLPFHGLYITRAVRMFMLARSLYREVLDPYLSRSRYALKKQYPQVKKPPKAMEVDGMVLTLVRRPDIPRYLGFAFPFALVMAVPLIGPAVTLFAQAAVAHLVHPLLTDRARLKAR